MHSTIKPFKTCPLILFFSALLIGAYGQKSAIQFDLEKGPYEVGFQVEYLQDFSRDFQDKNPKSKYSKKASYFRPVQTGIWYPASLTNSDKKLLYEDYFYLNASTRGPINLTEEVKSQTLAQYLETDPVDEDRLQATFEQEMWAFDRPMPKKGKFPVIIYGPSWWSSTYENARLFEFLASHGYIVVSSPSRGPDVSRMPLDRIGAETQARDMEFLIGHIQNFPNADIQQLCLAGFSWGGLSNVLLASRNKHIDAWIGYDPSIHEAYDIFEQSANYGYNQLRMPSLFINSFGYMNDLPFYDKLVYSNAYVIDLPHMDHTDFASQFIKLAPKAPESPIGPIIKGYELLCEYSLIFLNSVFKNKDTYDQLLQKLKDHPSSDLRVNFKSKSALPLPDEISKQLQLSNNTQAIDQLFQENRTKYPEKDFRKIIYTILKKGNNQLGNRLLQNYSSYYPSSSVSKSLSIIPDDKGWVFKEIYERNEDCSFSYKELNHTAHVLQMQDRLQDGLRIFQLNEQLRPDNFKAQFNLGLGYFRSKDYKMAQKHFELCLEKNPDDRYAGLARDFIAKIPQ